MVLRCRCGGLVVECDGEAICSRCGVVHETVPASCQTWSEAMRARVFGGKWRLERLNRVVSHNHDRSARLIEVISQKCALPDATYRRALSLHASTVSHNLHLGWSTGARVAAVVTLACRLEGVPRTTKTICGAAGVTAGQAHHVYGKIVDGLGITVLPPDPATFIGSIASACNIPEPVRRRAVGILKDTNTSTCGKDPTTLAAAALYKACVDSSHDVSQQELADAANTSTVSLRLRRDDLESMCRGCEA